MATHSTYNSHFIVTSYATIWACVCVWLPLLVAAWFGRRHGVGWRYFASGALIAVLPIPLRRLLIHAPLDSRWIVRTALTIHWRTSLDDRSALGVVLALIGVVVGEVGRCIGYQLLMRRTDRTWDRAVLYGLGYGWLKLVLEVPVSHPGPWLDRLGCITACGMLLGIWPIVCDLAVDVALSLLVLQVFRKGRLRWLGLATVANAVYATTLLLLSPLLSQFSWTATFLARAAFYGSFGMGSLWLIGDMRDRDEPCGGSSTP